MRRGTSGLCGILAIDKPSGMTSHDVVNRVRRLTGERRVGHTGTLDPMATGLMFVAVGAATRLSDFLMGHDKSYVARVVFGAATDTDDKEGRIVTAYSKNNPGEGLGGFASLVPEDVVHSLEGNQLQLPPAYSAIKKNGVTAYKAAREGKDIELEPRPITIFRSELLETGVESVDLDDGQGGRFVAELPYWDIDLSVSKGTYIRSIARDLGQSLGCGAHLSALRRENVHGFTVDKAYTLEQLEELSSSGLGFPWVDPVEVLGLSGKVNLTAEQMNDVSNGRKVLASVPEAEEGDDVCCVFEGRLVAIYQKQGNCLKPHVVIPGGVCGVGGHSSKAAASKANIIRWNPLGEVPAQTWADGCVMAMGVFDGVHMGHHALLRAAKDDACERDLPFVAITFSQDPDEVLGNHEQDFKLMDNKSRINALAARSGAEALLVIETDEATMAMNPQAFLDSLEKVCRPLSVHVGKDFRFGCKGAGDVFSLDAWCKEHGGSCVGHELVEFEGAAVTSTRIRRLLAEGNVDEARRMTPFYFISGSVARGRGEGTDFGFATANVEPFDNGVMMPREGVYGGYAIVDGRRYAAAVNMGVALSFEEAKAPIEAHLLDFSGDLYGKSIVLQLVHWLRPQQKFDDLDLLIKTVMGDIDWVRTNLGQDKTRKGR